MRLRTLYLAMALVMAVPRTVSAVPPDIEAKAEELFRQARELMGAKDYRKALKLLSTSQELDFGVGKLANIAICEAELGMVANAHRHFLETREKLDAGDPRLPLVEQYLAHLSPRLPYLRIDLAAAAPTDARVTLDEKLIDSAKLGTETPIDPGKHQVVVTAPGRVERRYEVTTEEGKRAVVSVEPGSAPVPSAAAPTSPPPAATSPSDAAQTRSLAPSFVLGALGVIGIGTGVGFVAAREGKRSEAVSLGESLDADGIACYDGAPSLDATRCKALRDTTAAGDLFGSLSWVGFVTAGIATAGALTYALWPSPKKGAPPAATLTWAPVLGAREQGIVLSGSF